MICTPPSEAPSAHALPRGASAFRVLARWARAAELPVLLAVMPALLFPTPTRVAVVVLIPALWVFLAAGGIRPLPRTPFNAAICCLLVMVGVSIAVTPDISFSLGKVSGTLLGALTFWATVRWMTTPSRLAVGLAVFALAGAGLAAVGLLGTHWPIKFLSLTAIAERVPPAIRGIPGAEGGFNSNAVGGALILFLPFQAALLLTTLDAGGTRSLWARKARLLSPVLLAALFTTAATLVLTQSRGAWFALAVAGACGALYYWRVARIVVAVVATLLLAAATVFPSRWSVADTLDRLRLDALDYGLRTHIWTAAVTGICDHPITGMGMNSFRTWMPSRFSMSLFPANADVAHAHNNFLQSALDLGLPGMVAYAALWWVAARVLIRVYRHAEHRADRALAGGLGVGLLAYFVFGLTDAIPLGAKVGLFYWIALALVAGLNQVCLPSAPAARHGGRTPVLPW